MVIAHPNIATVEVDFRCTENVRVLWFRDYIGDAIMAAIAKTKPKEQRIDSRVSANAKALLQHAAAARQKSVSEFVLDSAQTAAAEALADRREFLLDKKQWSAFLEALDAPPKKKPRLEKLLKSPSVFE